MSRLVTHQNVFIIILAAVIATILILAIPRPVLSPTTTSIISTSTPATAPADLTLAVGTTGTVEDLSITLNSVVQDSRCPIDVQCIQAGTINSSVTFKSGTESETINMPSGEVPQQFAGYTISIIKTDPPRRSHQEILSGDYRITFHVAHE